MSEKLNADALNDYHGRHVQYGQVHEMVHSRGLVTILGQFAGDLIKNHVAANGLSPMDTPVEVAARACDIAHAFFEQLQARRWLIELPPLTEYQKQQFTDAPVMNLANLQGQRRN